MFDSHDADNDGGKVWIATCNKDSCDCIWPRLSLTHVEHLGLSQWLAVLYSATFHVLLLVIILFEPLNHVFSLFELLWFRSAVKNRLYSMRTWLQVRFSKSHISSSRHDYQLDTSITPGEAILSDSKNPTIFLLDNHRRRRFPTPLCLLPLLLDFRLPPLLRLLCLRPPPVLFPPLRNARLSYNLAYNMLYA